MCDNGIFENILLLVVVNAHDLFRMKTAIWFVIYIICIATLIFIVKLQKSNAFPPLTQHDKSSLLAVGEEHNY